MANDAIIHMESGVSHRDGHPFVNLTWGSMRGQLTAAEARMHALALLECAEGAETDALVLRTMNETFGSTGDSENMALALIQMLREGRGQKWNQAGR